MTIKQNGGIFGRNPTFNNVTVGGTLTVDQIVEKTGAAGITLDGITLKDGNVVLADGNGIDFSATSGTGTSELFDDYEEGMFTPYLFGTTSAGTATYTTQSGYYTKIGRVVYFQIALDWSAFTGTGLMYILGLPFGSDGSAPEASVCFGAVHNVALDPNYMLVGTIDKANVFIRLQEVLVGGGAMGNVFADAEGGIRLSGNYIAG